MGNMRAKVVAGLSLLLITTQVQATGFDSVMNTMCHTCKNEILQSQTPTGSFVPSQVYQWQDLLKAVSDAHLTGIGSLKLWMGDEDDSGSNAWKYGLVNLAAFLAQSMKETIKYDACDENNWDSSTGYPASNACGQLGQSYQDYQCGAEDAHMACEVDPGMEIRGTTNAQWYGAPAAFFCAPRSKIPEAPRWNHGGWCDPNVERDTDKTVDEYFDYLQSGGRCEDYVGQKAGFFEACGGGGCANAPAPAFGQPARTDVEGCCWWGRGVIQTTGICNFGKLNYHLGARAAREGRPALFPAVDFCRDPGLICTSQEHPELKWVAGLFYWLESVQRYDVGGFNYKRELKAWVDAGMQSPGADQGFIHAASGIVNRGCHNPPCGSGSLDGGHERAQNFETVLRAFGLVGGGGAPTCDWTPSVDVCSRPPSLPSPPSLPTPTPEPSPSPTPTPEPSPTPTPTPEPSPNPTPEPSPSPEPEPPAEDEYMCVGKPDGHYPRGQCNPHVAKCRGGLPHLLECAAGAVFDTASGRCQWEADSVCSVQ